MKPREARSKWGGVRCGGVAVINCQLSLGFLVESGETHSGTTRGIRIPWLWLC